MEGSEPATEILPSGLDVRNVSFRLTWPEMRLLLVLAAVQFTHIVDFMIIMPLGPRMEAGLHLNLEEFSNIVAVYAVSAAVATSGPGATGGGGGAPAQALNRRFELREKRPMRGEHRAPSRLNGGPHALSLGKTSATNP